MANQNDTHENVERSPNEPTPDWINWFREHSIPIAGVIAFALVICLVQSFSTSTIDWTKTKDFTDALRNVTQALAFIAGGIWAYFKFVKARTFQESLIPVVSGRFAVIDGRFYLVVTTQIKNVGLSRIEFDPAASVLVVCEYTQATLTEIHVVAYQRLTSFQMFPEKGRSIEPNEMIEGQTLIGIPGSVQLAYRLELEILSLSGETWRATSIVDKSTLRDNAAVEKLLSISESRL